MAIIYSPGNAGLKVKDFHRIQDWYGAHPLCGLDSCNSGSFGSKVTRLLQRRQATSSGGAQIKALRQILLRLPQPLNRAVDSLANGPPVEILLPAEPLKGNALDQVVLKQLLLVG